MADVTIDAERVAAFARFFRERAAAQPFDFCSPCEGTLFPARGAPGVAEYFFFCTAHQFGFWLDDGISYTRPMTARVGGQAYKGSDFVWRCATRALEVDALFFHPDRFRDLTTSERVALFAADDGVNPLPMLDAHLQLMEAYCNWFTEQQTTPRQILVEAQAADRPLARFLQRAGAIPGYAEDPLQKKLQLLAVILENRPEHFLCVTDPASYRPIIDYHLQRSALRTGLVVVEAPTLRRKLEARHFVGAGEESALRQATYDAIDLVVRDSGASVAAVDYFFFTNRTRCPEMSSPDCASCPVKTICRQSTDLFQPVFRTTAY